MKAVPIPIDRGIEQRPIDITFLLLFYENSSDRAKDNDCEVKVVYRVVFEVRRKHNGKLIQQTPHYYLMI